MNRREPSVVLKGAALHTPPAEAYRALRANVNFSAIGHGVRSILIASGTPGEGKSTTLANLAILLAQAGQRIIMVDADFRRPRLRELFSTNGAGPAPLGLSTLIGGGATSQEVAVPVHGIDNLWLVPTGPIPPNPSELIASPRMRAVIADLCDHADVVLVDSPPCSVYSDAVELTQATDGILYVLRSGPLGPVNHQRILKQLQQGKARLIGVVMNQVDGRQGGYELHPRAGVPQVG
jgi:capsular exopolysaccharide synthesis family protein